MNVLDSITEINYDALSGKEKENILDKIYSEIDAIDDSLVELLNYRAEKYELLSLLKKQLGIQNYLPEREMKILKHVELSSKKNLSSVELKQIFERIIDVSRAMQKRVRENSK